MHPSDNDVIDCVPVSTTKDFSPLLETKPADVGDLDQIFRAIRTLKRYGWVVGVDQELLPPLWAIKRDGD